MPYIAQRLSSRFKHLSAAPLRDFRDMVRTWITMFTPRRKMTNDETTITSAQPSRPVVIGRAEGRRAADGEYTSEEWPSDGLSDPDWRLEAGLECNRDDDCSAAMLAVLANGSSRGRVKAPGCY